MKKIILTIILSNIFCLIFAQSIFPTIDTEFCPNQNITFTVRLPEREPGSAVTVEALLILNVTQANHPSLTLNAYAVFDTSASINGVVYKGTKFNFVGKFGDDNIKQTFREKYTPKNSSVIFLLDFNFKYIKSLKNPSPISPGSGRCKSLFLNVSNITVPRCTIQNIPISFDNIKWSTYNEGNDFLLGYNNKL